MLAIDPYYEMFPSSYQRPYRRRSNWGADTASVAQSVPNLTLLLANEAAGVERTATFLGLGLGLVGAIAGGFVGRWAGGHRPVATMGGAVVGGVGTGLSGFFIGRRILATNAAQRLAQQQAATIATAASAAVPAS